MRADRRSSFRGRLLHASTHNRQTMERRRTKTAPLSKRERWGRRNALLPFAPPERWYEPSDEAVDGFRLVVEDPGPGFCHVVTPDEVRQRLTQLPPDFLRSLEVIQFSRMTRKKRSFPCYGMQWGNTLYLYPIEESLTEEYQKPPKPAQEIEARMYGATWTQTSDGLWQLAWTLPVLKDFYLNNILIHELGHLLDDRNTSYVDRERYAEWFALRYGYPHSQARLNREKRVTVRHG